MPPTRWVGESAVVSVGVGRLEGHELAEELVVLGVGQLRARPARSTARSRDPPPRRASRAGRRHPRAPARRPPPQAPDRPAAGRWSWGEGTEHAHDLRDGCPPSGALRYAAAMDDRTRRPTPRRRCVRGSGRPSGRPSRRGERGRPRRDRSDATARRDAGTPDRGIPCADRGRGGRRSPGRPARQPVPVRGRRGDPGHPQARRTRPARTPRSPTGTAASP